MLPSLGAPEQERRVWPLARPRTWETSLSNPARALNGSPRAFQAAQLFSVGTVRGISPPRYMPIAHCTYSFNKKKCSQSFPNALRDMGILLVPKVPPHKVHKVPPQCVWDKSRDTQTARPGGLPHSVPRGLLWI